MISGAPERASSIRRELTRKAIHLASAAVPIALAAGIGRRFTLLVLAALTLVAIGVESARATSSIAALRFNAIFQPLLRSHETRAITGATWLIVSLFAAVLLLPVDIAIAATWAAAVGDAVAALVGMRFGRHRSARDGKSLEGSAACLVATLIGTVLLARLPVTLALPAALAAAGAERLPWPRDDNVRIVALVGIVTMVVAAL